MESDTRLGRKPTPVTARQRDTCAVGVWWATTACAQTEYHSRVIGREEEGREKKKRCTMRFVCRILLSRCMILAPAHMWRSPRGRRPRNKPRGTSERANARARLSSKCAISPLVRRGRQSVRPEVGGAAAAIVCTHICTTPRRAHTHTAGAPLAAH